MAPVSLGGSHLNSDVINANSHTIAKSNVNANQLDQTRSQTD